MQIRNRLTLQFTSIVACIYAIAMLAIYLAFSNFREEEFYARLTNKAKYFVHLLISVEEIDQTLLKKIERNSPNELPGEHVIIYDLDDNKIFDLDEDKSLTISKQLIQEVKAAKEVRFKQEGLEILGYYISDGDESIIAFIAARDVFGLRKLKILRFIIWVVFSGGLIIVYLAGRLYSQRALNPINEIINQVNNIDDSSLNKRLDEGNKKDELAKLSQTFNGMLARLETAFRAQRSFIANASHEIRNPLAAVTGQLEVVLLKDRNTDEYKASITSVLEDIKELNLILNKLLMLAHTSSETSVANFMMVRIDEVIWKSRTALIKQYPDYTIEVDIDLNFNSEEDFCILGNETLLLSAITNLMENGCKYSTNKSVQVKLENHKNRLEVNFTDNGIGIPEQEQSKIFESFYRASNAQQEKGHGIGLSLVKGIINLHKGHIHLSSRINMGTSVLISFETMQTK